jgi:uncharacterized damage-inducible protein DinB
MDMLDRLLGHDAATTREYLQICLNLTDEEWDRPFDIGWETLRKTFNHMIGNIEMWTDLMMERPVRSLADQESPCELMERADRAYDEFAAFARKITDEGRLDGLWRDVLDKPPTQKSYGGGIGHVITHNMHHRAELQHIMHRLNIQHVPEGDLMGWDQKSRYVSTAQELPESG